jgi:hypothetical protein
MSGDDIIYGQNNILDLYKREIGINRPAACGGRLINRLNGKIGSSADRFRVYPALRGSKR